MRCNSCDSAVINGAFAHEHGCPDSHLHVVRECAWCGQTFRHEEYDPPGLIHWSLCSEDCAEAYHG